MKLSSARMVAWLAVAIIAAGCIAESRNLLVGTPEEVIRQRASRMPAPFWQIPLGPALVEDMQILGPDRLLVGLKKDFPGLPNLDYMLVNTEKGQVVWRHKRNSDGAMYHVLLALKDLLLFRIEAGKTVSLLALDPQTGRELWTSKAQGSGIMHLPVLASSRIVTAIPSGNAVQLAAVNLEDGAVAWEKTVPTGGGASWPAPMVDGEDILLFYKGIERLSSMDGHRAFLQPDLNFDENSPPPQLEGDEIWAIDALKKLTWLNANNGKVRGRADLPPDAKYTNIYPLGGKIYLRAITEGGDSRLYSLRSHDGEIVWTHTGKEQSVSNLLEGGGLLYFGTPTSLVALEAASGKQVFSSLVTTTGRTFPVRIRTVRDQVVYIGELVVAAYDAKTGALRYSHGMTPICPECHLNGLDAASPRLKEELQQASSKPIGNLGDLSNLATAEMVRYQNLANTYSGQAWDMASRGDYIGSDLASMKSSFAKHEAKLQANTAFVYAVVDLGLVLRRALEAAAIKTSIERQELFRRSILGAYNQAESAEYVYRPHLEWGSAGDSFTTLSVVHIPSGKRRDTYLSPTYQSYGLWNLIDFEKGVVYHHGVGMNPSVYELSEARRLYPYSSARTVNNFLIAMPVEIPR
jgi:outer membrane protein assembly factor BamB